MERKRAWEMAYDTRQEKEMMATQRKLHKTARYKSSIETTRCVQQRKKNGKEKNTHAMTPDKITNAALYFPS